MSDPEMEGVPAIFLIEITCPMNITTYFDLGRRIIQMLEIKNLLTEFFQALALNVSHLHIQKTEAFFSPLVDG